MTMAACAWGQTPHSREELGGFPQAAQVAVDNFFQIGEGVRESRVCDGKGIGSRASLQNAVGYGASGRRNRLFDPRLAARAGGRVKWGLSPCRAKICYNACNAPGRARTPSAPMKRDAADAPRKNAAQDGTEPKANTTFAALAAAKQRAKASGQRGSNEPGESVSTTAS